MNRILFSSLLMVAFSAGCGGGDNVSVVPASGVLYLDDAPHGPANLTLFPIRTDESDKRRTASAQVAADGTFTLSSYGTGDGAAPGQYEVSLATAGGEAGSTDPAAMMAAIAAVPVQPATIEIPADGSDKLEVRLQSSSKSGGTSGGTLLGQ